jgi:hypothetical protein
MVREGGHQVAREVSPERVLEAPARARLPERPQQGGWDLPRRLVRL